MCVKRQGGSIWKMVWSGVSFNLILSKGLGFHALLPTCEILSLRFCDLELIESEELYLYRLANLAYKLGLREPCPPCDKMYTPITG